MCDSRSYSIWEGGASPVRPAPRRLELGHCPADGLCRLDRARGGPAPPRTRPDRPGPNPM